jgi:hypothetical protein
MPSVARPARDQLQRIRTNLLLLPRRFSADRRVLPDFLIIGAQKCGTSSLHARLAEHPQVLPPLTKEVHYFDRRPEYPLDWYRAHFPLRTSLADVAAGTGRTAATGEASPSYLFHPACAARIHRALPTAKLIVLLRNPVDRAYSHYQHVRRRGWEPMDFEAALDAEPDRLAAEARARSAETLFQGTAHRRFSYSARGLYADQLARYLEYFPRSSLLVVESESYAREPARIYSEVLDFLGLEPCELARHDKLHGFEYEAQPARTRNRLLEYFAPHNERLFALLGRRYDWSA